MVGEGFVGVSFLVNNKTESGVFWGETDIVSN